MLFTLELEDPYVPHLDTGMIAPEGALAEFSKQLEKNLTLDDTGKVIGTLRGWKNSEVVYKEIVYEESGGS